MAMLEISFYGPFFYNFQTISKGFVSISAPKCDGHSAEIFSAKTARPIRGRQKNGDFLKYQITGSAFKKLDNQTPPKWQGQSIILDATPDARPDYKKAHFTLHVPVPQYVYPLSPALMEVVKGSASQPTKSLKTQATGLRFYYEADLGPAKLVTMSTGDGDTFSTSFDTFYDGQNGDITVRYAESGPEDSDHRDAEECFCKIAELAGVDYWLCHEDQTDPRGLAASLVRRGDDCNSAVIVVQEPAAVPLN